MSPRYLHAALALGIALVVPASLTAQSPDSTRAPHMMAAVVVNGSLGRPSAVENARLKRDLAKYDARIATLQQHLDSLKTYADSLDRDRVHFEAATAQARARRTAIEQRLRQMETRSTSPGDSPTATP